MFTYSLNKAQILCALYNAAIPAADKTPLSLEDAKSLIVGMEAMPTRRMYVESLRGRVLNIDLTNATHGDLDVSRYDRVNGAGAAKNALRRYQLALTGEAVASLSKGVH